MAQFDFRKFVSCMIAERKAKRVVEVGVWRGNLSRKIWNLPCVELFLMVDPFSTEFTSIIREGKTHNMRMSQRRTDPLTQEELDKVFITLQKEVDKIPNACLWRCTSLQAAEFVKDRSIDFIFLDALHFYQDLKDDLEAWLPKIKPGGIVAGDDMSSRFPGVTRAVYEVFKTYNREGKVWWTEV